MNMKAIFTVMNTTLAVVKIRPEKNLNVFKAVEIEVNVNNI